MITKIFRRFSLIGDRYSQTLFKSAADYGDLEKVGVDMKYILELHKSSPDFKVLLTDPTIAKAKISEIMDDLAAKANFSETTRRMIHLLLANKRLSAFPEIAKNYEQHLKEREKKETVRVVAATSLTDAEKLDVQKALEENDSSKKYELTFEIDTSILGGLQLYFPTAFMDLSLRSRLEKIKEEVGSIAI